MNARDYNFEYVYGPEDTCDDYVHVDELKKYDHAADLLKEIINTIYVSSDVKELESSLDEMCDIFGLQLPQSKPLIKGV